MATRRRGVIRLMAVAVALAACAGEGEGISSPAGSGGQASAQDADAAPATGPSSLSRVTNPAIEFEATTSPPTGRPLDLSNPVEAAIAAGISHYEEGQFRLAIDDYGRALALDPANFAALFDRGTAYSTIGEHQLAIDDYDRAAAVNSTYGTLFSNRGGSHRELGELEAALDDFSLAIELGPTEIDPTLSFAYQGRASVYELQGRYPLAIDDYGRLIEVDPTNAIAYYRRATAKAEVDDMTGALADLDESIMLTESGLASEPVPDLPEARASRDRVAAAISAAR